MASLFIRRRRGSILRPALRIARGGVRRARRRWRLPNRACARRGGRCRDSPSDHRCGRDIADGPRRRRRRLRARWWRARASRENDAGRAKRFQGNCIGRGAVRSTCAVAAGSGYTSQNSGAAAAEFLGEPLQFGSVAIGDGAIRAHEDEDARASRGREGIVGGAGCRSENNSQCCRG